MNALKLGLFDSIALSAAELSAADARPVRAPQTPASLWKQSLAAHEPTVRARWAMRGSFTVLGALSAASVVYALTEICHGVLSQHGLQAAVQSLMH